MKNVFNEAVVTNPEEVKGGLFLLSWLFFGFKGHGHSHGYSHGYNCGCKSSYKGSSKGGYSKW